MGILSAIKGYVSLDGSGFEKGAIKVENAAKRMAKSVTRDLTGAAAGAFGAFKATELIQGAIESVARIRQLSNEFRVSTDTIQLWDRAAKKAGQSAEDIGEAFNRAKKAREGAAAGDKDLGNAFGKFGVTVEMLKDSSLETETILNRMVESVAGRRILDDEDVAGMEIFGRSGAKVLSSFQALHDIGPVNLIAKEDIENIHRIEADFNRMKREAGTGAASILGELYKYAAYSSQAAGVLFENLRGKITMAEAKDALMVLANDTDGASESATGANSSGSKKDERHTTAAIVDLHKDDAEIARERLALANKILQNQLAAMTVDERRVVLKKEIADMEDKAFRAMIQGNDLEAARAAKEAEELRGQLIQADHKTGAPLHVDALNRMGGFVGGAENVSAALDREKINTMKQIHKTTGEILRQLSAQYPESLIK